MLFIDFVSFSKVHKNINNLENREKYTTNNYTYAKTVKYTLNCCLSEDSFYFLKPQNLGGSRGFEPPWQG